MSATELYPIVLRDDNERSSRVHATEQQLELAEDLGLTTQVQMLKRKIRLECALAAIETPPLSDIEKLVWRTFLPTRYTEIPRDGHRDIASYNYDMIPSVVLREWRSAQASGLFDRFEIWTPEHNPDPALIGIRDGFAWLIARWGESDANLLSFDDVKKIVIKRWKDERLMGIIMTFVAVVFSVLLFGGVVSFVSSAVALVIAGAFPLIGLMLVYALWKEASVSINKVLSTDFTPRPYTAG